MPRKRTPVPMPDHPKLSPREREIVVMVLAGSSNQQIARKFGLAVGTVKVHLQHAREKTQ